MTPRVIIAKYVPDVARMEPRNIGVFVWSKGAVCAKFLENEDAPFVNEQATFVRWKKYWASLISGSTIRPIRGKPVPLKEPACMDALLSTQEGNYILVDAAELLETVGKRELSKVADSLFQELVAPTVRGPRDAGTTLKRMCDSLFVRTKLSEREDFRRKYPVSCGMFGERRPLHFSYGFGNGRPNALLQRVALTSEVSVNNAALILHEVSDQGLVQKNRCAALIQGSSISSRDAELSERLLARICDVVDIESPAASTKIAEIAGEPVLHTENSDD